MMRYLLKSLKRVIREPLRSWLRDTSAGSILSVIEWFVITKILTQEVFVRVYKGLKRFRFKSSLWTWIYRITLNLCISFSKSKKRASLQNSLFPHPPTPQESYRREELRKAIDKAILSLPSQQRAVFIMHYYEDMKYKEIAEVMGCKLGTVKVHYFQAIRRLRELLKEWV